MGPTIFHRLSDDQNSFVRIYAPLCGRMEKHMKYISTRESRAGEGISSAEAIKRGLAPDGGLYLPDSIPALTLGDIDDLRARP